MNLRGILGLFYHFGHCYKTSPMIFFFFKFWQTQAQINFPIFKSKFSKFRLTLFKYRSTSTNLSSSIPHVYDNPLKFDHASSYFDDRYGGFSQSQSNLRSIRTRSDQRERFLRDVIRFATMVTRWSHTMIEAQCLSLYRGLHLMTVGERLVWLWEAFNCYCEFKQDREDPLDALI